MKRYMYLLLVLAIAVVGTSCRRNSGKAGPTTAKAADLSIIKKNDFSNLQPVAKDGVGGAGMAGMAGGGPGMQGGGPGMKGGGPGMMGGGPGMMGGK